MEQQRTRPKEETTADEQEMRHSPGQIVPVELDSTREDSLRDCIDAVRAKLPANEDG